MNFACKTKPPRLLVSDLDGTLLRSSKTVSPYTRSVLHKAKAEGMILVLASGRTGFKMDLYREPYLPADYHISSNGAELIKLPEGLVLSRECMAEEAAGKVLDYLLGRDVNFSAYAPERTYYRDGPEKGFAERNLGYLDLAARLGTRLQPEFIDLANERLRPEDQGKLLKFAVYSARRDVQEAFEAFVSGIEGLNFEVPERDITIVLAAEASKKKALLRLREALGISREETAVFGDYYNDLSMFEAAGLSVAPANAAEGVKAKADFICGSNEEDGVSRFIEDFLLQTGPGDGGSF